MDNVFLVDDDPAVLKSLSRALREEGWTVETFESAEAFLARHGPATRGCLVLDVTMPGLNGLELQHRLAESRQVLPIVFLTGDGDIPTSVQAIKAGAADFLTKPVASAVLSGVIRAAIEKAAAVRASQAEMEMLQQRLDTLTPREREVLVAVVSGRLNKQIAGDLGLVEQTIKFHRAKIMARMQAHSLAELMHIAARLGIQATDRH
jgi:FixJ family two-component response regulator